MKILHVSTTDSGGAGRAATRIHLGLKSIGIKSKMLVLRRSSLDNDVIKCPPSNNPLSLMWDRMRNKYVCDGFNAYKLLRPKESDLFSNDMSIYAISQHLLVKEADIIHLHWVATMVNYSEFFPNITNRPMAWTLHDINPFSGGCHYSNGCIQYQTGCGSCPQLGSKDTNDVSRKIFKRKEEIYKGRNIHVATPSKWLRDCAKKSMLFKNFPIDVISGGVSTDIFRIRDKKLLRNQLSLPQNKTLILFGADYKTERKGLKYLLEALKLLKVKIEPSRIALVTFGRHEPIKDTDVSVHQLGYIDDDLLLSDIYSAADMFVIPSIEEAFGQVCLESMACGTAPIGFNAGGIKDMITPHKTGLLAELINIQDLADKIEFMITHPEECRQMGENARKLVEQEYTLQIQAKRYLRLYGMMLSAAVKHA